MSLVDLLRSKKAMSILVCVYNNHDALYAAQLAKIIDSTHNTTSTLLVSLSRNGLVVFERIGRIKYIQLTRKGVAVAESLNVVRNLL